MATVRNRFYSRTCTSTGAVVASSKVAFPKYTAENKYFPASPNEVVKLLPIRNRHGLGDLAPVYQELHGSADVLHRSWPQERWDRPASPAAAC